MGEKRTGMTAREVVAALGSHWQQAVTFAERRTPQIRKALAAQLQRAWEWLASRRRTVFWTAGIIAVLLLIGFGLLRGHAFWKWWSFKEPKDQAFTHLHADLVVPLATFVGAAALAFAALAQAQIARKRHYEQTNADRQRRITESFSKAVDQLASDKLEARRDDYWTVMENLTAFVRERTRRTEAERPQRTALSAYFLWKDAGEPEGQDNEFWKEAEKLEFEAPPAPDIAVALTVILRRDFKLERKLEREKDQVLWLDFTGAVLRGANLYSALLDHATLEGAHLEGANLAGAQLQGAWLKGARLQDADLRYARLVGAHLQGRDLRGADLKSANLSEAHLEGADLRGAQNLSQSQIDVARGDTCTRLPSGLVRPTHWPTA
jgi:hypothetical protein